MRNPLLVGLREEKVHRFERRRRQFIFFFTVIIGLVLIPFGFYNLAAGTPLLGAAEIAVTLLLVWNYLHMKKGGGSRRAGKVILVLLFFLALLVFANGGVGNTGNLWLFTFPLIAYFLDGERAGNYWSGGLLLVLALFYGAELAGIWDFPYETVEIRQTLVVFFVVSAYSLFFQKTNQEARREILDAEANLRGILEKMQDAYYRTDEKGTVLYISPSVRENFGFEKEEVEGRPITDFYVNPEEREAFKAEMVRSGKVVGYQTRIRHKDGSDVWVSTNARMILDREGNTVGIEGVTRNIQAWKEAEIQLARMNETLERRVEEETGKRMEQEKLLIHQSRQAAMGEMIGAIAHQWRQPLNAVAIGVQDLQDAHAFGELDDYYLEQTVERTMNQIDFMSKTIDDFRNFFKPDREKVLFDAGQVLDEVLAMLEGQLASHGFMVERSGEKLPPVLGYPNELKQVFLNILSNGKDAMEEHRSLHKEQNRRYRFLIESFPDEEGGVEMRISNNGGAIPPEVLPRIFEPYFSTKEEGKGTGIGLYMSKTIVENNMGGSIRAENPEEGGEARFVITLPPAS